MWWLITAVVCTIVGLFFATCFAFAISDDGDDESMLATNTIVIVVIIYTIVNSITYSKTVEYDDRMASYTEAASLYGFSSGSEYPLDGDRSGESAINGGFSISGYGQMQAGASILVEHDVDGNSREILEIPLSNVAFRIINDGESSMAINFNAISSGLASGYVAKDVPSDCHTQIHWGWWTRKCATTSTTVTSTENEGLSGLFHKALASNPGKFVTMNITASEYQQILGASSGATETETPTPSPAQR